MQIFFRHVDGSLFSLFIEKDTKFYYILKKVYDKYKISFSSIYFLVSGKIISNKNYHSKAEDLNIMDSTEIKAMLRMPSGGNIYFLIADKLDRIINPTYFDHNSLIQRNISAYEYFSKISLFDILLKMKYNNFDKIINKKFYYNKSKINIHKSLYDIGVQMASIPMEESIIVCI
tara:strand:- start:368 stop:889 length:522 start_codon:yes stop_codon:yes gene_type:complete